MITTMTVHTPHGPSKVNAIQTNTGDNIETNFRIWRVCLLPSLFTYNKLLRLTTTKNDHPIDLAAEL